MMFKVMGRSLSGLGFAAIITFVALTILMVKGMEVSVTTIWMNMLGSIVMGVYFGSASLIFEIENWSPLKQTVIHFFISLMVWLPIGLCLGWIPFDSISLLISIFLFVVTYLFFWYSTRLYFLKIAKEMNNSVRKK